MLPPAAARTSDIGGATGEGGGDVERRHSESEGHLPIMERGREYSPRRDEEGVGQCEQVNRKRRAWGGGGLEEGDT